jgi:D-glutamate cyclase
MMSESAANDDWLTIMERAIRRDPARRGLLSSAGEELCPGHLAAAADHLSRFGRQVWILTGFYIPAEDFPAAETDGPPGAAALAAMLTACGMEPVVITDSRCASAVQCAAEAYGLSHAQVAIGPEAAEDYPNWCRQQHARSHTPLTHVVSIERVGPAHQPEDWGATPLAADFRSCVAREHWGRCHNMRGQIIDPWTAPLHEVLRWVHTSHPGCRTIGVGDGGNELGMGAIPYRELRRRLPQPQGAIIPCRWASDWTILAGVSNWGGFALGAAVCGLSGQLDALSKFDRVHEEARLNHLVTTGPAIDGVTRRQEPTVDGLPFLTYLQPWEVVLELLAERGR